MDVSSGTRNVASEIEEEVSDDSTCWTAFGSFSIAILIVCLKIIVGGWRVVLESESIESEESESNDYDDEASVSDNRRKNLRAIFRTGYWL